MEIDDILSQLNSDLEQIISGMDNVDNDNFTSQQVGNNEKSLSSDIDEKFIYCSECGTKLPADSRFCSNCGMRIDEEDEDEGGEDKDSATLRGIIWTDTHVLSEKYGDRQKDILESLNSYISECKNHEIEWYLLDMADHQKELGEATWMDFSDVLEQYMRCNGIKHSPKLSLFIIGGNDVIPQPAEENLCGDPRDDYQDTVYADFYYCFYGRLPLDLMDFNKARCNVARLPLEMGQMATSFNDDVVSYLRKCLNIAADGISIGHAVMTSNVDWIPASREMSRNLPTPHMDDVEGETLDNMYLSPEVMAADTNEDLQKRYNESLSDADMLVFNLHGACLPNESSFYYSGGEAFTIDMLGKTNAKLFNTVACWGGRYIKYKREDSMLLNAIYNNGVMLYSGSCVPALGKCGNYQHDSTWRINPAAYSETFMARFSEYECIGSLPVGEAFLKAKCDYYNSSRSLEEDEYTLGTVMMFNLYGCPLLRTVPDEDAIEEMQTEDGSKLISMHVEAMPIPFRKMQKRVVMKNNSDGKTGSASLLDEIRSVVDANLLAIHKAITENLYNYFGVEPRELESVEKYSTFNVKGYPENGYIYNYKRHTGCIDTYIRVKVDERGNLIDAIQTK